jgi:hypothetical protein
MDTDVELPFALRRISNPANSANPSPLRPCVTYAGDASILPTKSRTLATPTAFQPPLSTGCVAQQVLLHLAHGVARQLGGELCNGLQLNSALCWSRSRFFCTLPIDNEAALGNLEVGQP